jgi:hypothetical protein
MRTITNFTNGKEIPPMGEREWNYSFGVGERVKLIPEMVNLNNNEGYFYEININESLIDRVGIIKNCYPDLHCDYGTSFMCLVDFDGVEIKLMSMFLYTSLKFYK